PARLDQHLPHPRRRNRPAVGSRSPPEDPLRMGTRRRRRPPTHGPTRRPPPPPKQTTTRPLKFELSDASRVKVARARLPILDPLDSLVVWRLYLPVKRNRVDRLVQIALEPR